MPFIQWDTIKHDVQFKTQLRTFELLNGRDEVSLVVFNLLLERSLYPSLAKLPN